MRLFATCARCTSSLPCDSATFACRPSAAKQSTSEKVGVLHEQDLLQKELPESSDVGVHPVHVSAGLLACQHCKVSLVHFVFLCLLNCPCW